MKKYTPVLVVLAFSLGLLGYTIVTTLNTAQSSSQSAATINADQAPQLPPVATLQNIFPAGLQAYYPFDGDGNDVSGNARNLTPLSAPSIADRIVDQGVAATAVSFDGSANQALTYAGSGGLVNAYTVSLWFKLNNLETQQKIISFFAGYADLYSHGSDILWDLRQADGTHTSLIIKNTDLQWHNIMVSFDGATLSQYLDGVRVSTGPRPLAISHAPNAISIGNYSYGKGDPFQGMVDEVMVFNRALSGDEISDLYNSQKKILIADSLKRPGCFLDISIQESAADVFVPGGNPKSVQGSYLSDVRVHEADDEASYILRTYDSTGAIIAEYNIDDAMPEPIIAESFSADGTITSLPTEPLTYPQYVETMIPASPTVVKYSVIHGGSETVINTAARYGTCQM